MSAEQHVKVDTASPAAAAEFLVGTYKSVKFLAYPKDGFRFGAQRLCSSNFSVDFIRYPGDMLIGVAGLFVVHVVEGVCVIGSGQDAIKLQASEIAVCDTVGVKPMLVRHAVVRIFRIDIHRVHQAICYLRADPGELCFGTSRPIGPAQAHHWGIVTNYALHVLDSPRVVRSDLCVESAFQVLAAALVETFPVQIDLSAGKRSGVTRKALRFIAANARKPVGIPDVANAAGVEIRTLQLWFARDLGVTPTTYLRDFRIEGIHRDLVSADPTQGATVSKIVENWHIGHHGRFSKNYFNRYGKSPSETLHFSAVL